MSDVLPFLPGLNHLPVYQPGRPIEEVARQLGLNPADVVKLASNENPLGPSPAALEAIKKTLPQLHLYPDGTGFHLKNKLADKLGVDPANLVLGNGSNEVLEMLGHILLDAAAQVVVSQYCFAVYPIVTRLFGAELITVPARDLGHDLPAMLNAVTPKTRILFVSNPNNPTGTIAPRADLVRLLNEIPNHVLLVIDEAYIEYLNDPLDLLPLVRRGDRPNLLLVRTFSKIYGLAGLRLGYGIGHPAVIGAFEKVRQPFNSNALAQAAALAALDDAEHVARTRANNALGLEYLQNSFRQLTLPFVPSFANFILVKVGDGQQVFEALQREGVITRPMAGYQLPEWLRISIGTPAENARCMIALKKVLRR